MGLINPYHAAATPAAQSMSMIPGGGGGGDLTPTATQPVGFVGMPLSWWIGAIVLLLALKVLSEHENVKLNPAHIHIGGYDLAVMLTAWMVGWTAIKLSVNRWAPQSAAAEYANWL